MKELLTLVTPYHFNALLKEGISLDHVYMLVSLQQDIAWQGVITAKQKALIQALERKFFITADGRLTPTGEQLLAFFQTVPTETPETRPLKPKNTNDAFEAWWKAFPSTDAVIVDKKVLYPPSRSLKGKKEEALGLFEAILMEGYTVEQLIKAVEYEVQSRINRSIEEKKNCMKYMINSSSYLRQRIFVQFIEVAELAGSQEQKKRPTGVMDI